jgi:hypothetical protein
VRPDMAKVLVERPRSGGRCIGKGYLKTLQRTPIEELPGREGIKERWRGGSKWLTDLLGPLRRFLRSNVGRPWNLVHSEICVQLRRAFPERENLIRHVYNYVERDVNLVDGVPCHRGGMLHGTPLRRRYGPEFYVCPRTGLLRVKPPRRKTR